MPSYRLHSGLQNSGDGHVHLSFFGSRWQNLHKFSLFSGRLPLKIGQVLLFLAISLENFGAIALPTSTRVLEGKEEIIMSKPNVAELLRASGHTEFTADLVTQAVNTL
jgi:hypothetical protein